jgi:hypothetical protein
MTTNLNTPVAVGWSVAEGGQVELAEPLGVGEDVDLDSRGGSAYAEP